MENGKKIKIESDEKAGRNLGWWSWSRCHPRGAALYPPPSSGSSLRPKLTRKMEVGGHGQSTLCPRLHVRDNQGCSLSGGRHSQAVRGGASVPCLLVVRGGRPGHPYPLLPGEEETRHEDRKRGWDSCSRGQKQTLLLLFGASRSLGFTN